MPNFNSWDVRDTIPAEDLIIDAAHEIMTYTVNFVDSVTGKSFAEAEVEYSSMR